jgi:hypothetical protein
MGMSGAWAQGILKIEVYTTGEEIACGPGGYDRDSCNAITIDRLQDLVRRGRVRPFKTAIVVPPETIVWSATEVSFFRNYSDLGELPPSRRIAAVVLFEWIGNPPSQFRLTRRSDTGGRATYVRPLIDRRAIYHVPVQHLEPSAGEVWTIGSGRTQVNIRFSY